MKNSFYSAVLTLSIFTVIDRFLGFGFKIYLSRVLGASALGVYSVAFSFFMVLLTATTSGIPLVVSKLTARKNNDKKSSGVVSASLIIGLVISVIAVAVAFLPVINIDGRSKILLYILLPGLFFSAIYSSFRGSLWGQKRYFAVSIVEIIEQVCRIIACVILFIVGVDKLVSTAVSLPIGCFCSAVTVSFIYFLSGGKLSSPKGEIKPLLRSSLPITVSRMASSLVGSLTAVIVPFLLTTAGASENQALALYGSGVGMALPLLYIPITLVGSLAFALIPTVSQSYGEKNFGSVNRQISNAVVFSVVIAGAFAPIYSVLGEQIGTFVYDDVISGYFLSKASWTLVPLVIESLTSSVMNSLDLEKNGFVNYLIGSLASFIFMLSHYGSFDIFVVPTALGIGWAISSVLHIISISKRTGLGVKFWGKCVISCLLIFPTCTVCRAVANICSPLHLFFILAISSVVAMIFYLLACLLFGVVSPKLFGIYFTKRSKKVKTLAK
ncbi:MAG: oligosaccharide flippase family protein [Clostridia bacterium]|nr:oligosaccharide flippase family protein [Clostridia bacterium]